MAPPSFRAALYWTPRPDDPLYRAGTSWLGRDAERNLDCAQPPIPGIAAVTAAPRLYGFHATLRPPMRLSTGWPEFRAAAEDLAQNIEPFALPFLGVTEISGFLALCETVPCPALRAFAESCIVATNPHRLPPTEAEQAKRRAMRLTQRQEHTLERWGYPYVMQDWRFHMTLTRRLDAAEMQTMLPAAKAHFTEALAKPRRVTDIAIFTQASPATATPFLIAERIPLKKAVLF